MEEQAEFVFGEFWASSLSIPVSQLTFLVGFVSLFLIFAKHRFGLVGAYGILIYWIYGMNRSFFMDAFKNTEIGVYLFGFFAIIMGCIGIVGFARKDD